MRKTVALVLTGVALACATLAAVIGGYPVFVCDWFSDDYSGYEVGDRLSDAGAEGGSWGTIADDVAASVADVAGRRAVALETAATAGSDEVRFAPTNAVSAELTRYDFSINTAAAEVFPDVPSDTSAGFAVYAADESDEPSFIAYTSNGWVRVYGLPLESLTNVWLDCRAEFDYKSDGGPYVCYYVWSGTEYVRLADTNGLARFQTAVTAKTEGIAFRGAGTFGAFSGYRLDVDSSRLSDWVGEHTGNWDDTANWSPAQVPVEGATVHFSDYVTVSRTVAGTAYSFYIAPGGAMMVVNFGTGITVDWGTLYISGDWTAWGPITIEAGAGLDVSAAATRIAGLKTGYRSRLAIDIEKPLTVTDGAVDLEGIYLELQGMPTEDAYALVVAGYGSSGLPVEWLLPMVDMSKWMLVWHTGLDDTATLWLVRRETVSDIAIWTGLGDNILLHNDNWGETKPSSSANARIGIDAAPTHDSGSFYFANYFQIGYGADVTAALNVSGGTIDGDSMILGTEGGTGSIDLGSGALTLYDFLWNPALTLGAEAGSSGALRQLGGTITLDGGLSVGDGGTGDLTLSSGTIDVSGIAAVGGTGTLTVSGGSIENRGGRFIVGRGDSEAAYDVSMTVSGGTVSNVSPYSAVLALGARGGVGSFAQFALSGGEVYAGEGMIVGEYRSAEATISGGRLVTPFVTVGASTLGLGETATLRFLGGELVTGGIATYAPSLASLELAGGDITATADSTDFFSGFERLSLKGTIGFETENDVSIAADVTGSGGFTKRGAGTLRINGYSVWCGETTVSEGTLDYDGGMVLGPISIDADAGAATVNAKMDTVRYYPLDRFITGDWFAVEFADVAVDTVLDTDTGVKYGGSWGSPAVPSGAEAVVADEASRRGLYLDTGSAEDGLRFTATEATTGDVVNIEFSLCAAGAEEYPDVPANAKASLTIMRDDDTAPAYFAAYTGLGWVPLAFQDGSELVENTWYDLRMSFDLAAGKDYVSFLVKRNGTYERLVSEDGCEVFPVVSAGKTVAGLAISGAGLVTDLYGRQLELDTSDVYHWIGPSNGDWSDGANWSHTAGGTPAGTVPNGTSLVIFDGTARVNLGDAAAAKDILVSSNTRLSNGALALARKVSGPGLFTLDGVALTATGPDAAIDLSLALVGNDSFHNAVGCPLVVTGAVRGDGTLTVTQTTDADANAGTRLGGDWSAFSGSVAFVLKADDPAAPTHWQAASDDRFLAGASSSSAASWTVYAEGSDAAGYAVTRANLGHLFAETNGIYRFGALDLFLPSDGLSLAPDVTLELGALDAGSRLRGAFGDTGATVVWLGATSTLTNESAGIAALDIRGGTVLALAEASLPSDLLTYVAPGGVLKVGAGLTADLSGIIADSDAYIAFDDGGEDHVWTLPLAASNTGGLLKRGAGTLTLKAIPLYTGDTVVEEGTLIVPFGTRLGRVVLGTNAKILVDLTGATENAVIFSASSANVSLDNLSRLNFINVPEDYEWSVYGNGDFGIVVANGTRNFIWTPGYADSRYENAQNWRVDGHIPATGPQAYDRIQFPQDRATSVVDVASSVIKCAVVGDLTLAGGRTLEINNTLDMSGSLAFESAPMSADSASADWYGSDDLSGVSAVGTSRAAELTGQGRFHAERGSLTVSPDAGESRFVGTLSGQRFVKEGAGTFVFTGFADLTESLDINAGTFALGNYSAFGGLRMEFDASVTNDCFSYTAAGDVQSWVTVDENSTIAFTRPSSGAGVGARVTTDYFDGRRAVAFRSAAGSGTGSFSRFILKNAGDASPTQTLFVVYQADAYSSGNFIYADLSVGTAAGGLCWNATEQGYELEDPTAGIFAGVAHDATVADVGVPALLGWCGPAGWLDGTESLGGSSYGSGTGFSGAIGAIVCFNRPLTHAERLVVSRTLMNRWGISDTGYPIAYAATVTMKEGATFDLGGEDVAVGSFVGAGTVANGTLRPKTGRIVQSGGSLTVPAVDGMTYVAYRAGSPLVISDGVGKHVTIVIPDDWYAAGGSGLNMVFCEAEPEDITWVLPTRASEPVTTGDGWYSLGGSGFTIRLR